MQAILSKLISVVNLHIEDTTFDMRIFMVTAVRKVDLNLRLRTQGGFPLRG